MALTLSGCATPQSAPLADFEAVLDRQDSATVALTEWCAAQGLAPVPKITAVPVVGGRMATPLDVRQELDVAEHEPLGLRHVRLICGETVMSEAYNWFVPSRLTPDMNETLSATRTPFGTVVAPLQFSRERLESLQGAAPGCPQDTILSHRALLRLPDGTPISLVQECYTPANLKRQ